MKRSPAAKPKAKSQASPPPSVSTSPRPTPLTDANSLPRCPTVPVGIKPMSRPAVNQLRKLTDSQKVRLAAVASEISGSSTYASDFGSYAPLQADVADLLLGAAEAVAEVANASDWAKYVADLSAVTNDAVVQAIAKLGDGLSYAAIHGVDLSSRYPLLAAFVGERSEISTKMIAARKAARRKG